MRSSKLKRFALTSGLALIVSAMFVFSSSAQDISSKVQPISVEPTKDVSGAADDQASQEAELAKKLQNPIAALISVPIQNNWDFGIGPAHAMKYTANIQPVVPISISEDWNLIIRTIVPVIYQEALDNRPGAPASVGKSHSGLGDT